jgi:hypothetical protein
MTESESPVFVTRDPIPLVAFHVTRQDRFGWAGGDSFSQWFRHPLYIVRVQPQFLGNLRVGQVQPMK